MMLCGVAFSCWLLGARVGEASHPGPARAGASGETTLKKIGKHIITDKTAKAHVGDSFEAAYKDKAFVGRISKRMPSEDHDNLRTLHLFFKAKLAKDQLRPCLETSAAATNPSDFGAIPEPLAPAQTAEPELQIVPYTGPVEPIRRPASAKPKPNVKPTVSGAGDLTASVPTLNLIASLRVFLTWVRSKPRCAVAFLLTLCFFPTTAGTVLGVCCEMILNNLWLFCSATFAVIREFLKGAIAQAASSWRKFEQAMAHEVRGVLSFRSLRQSTQSTHGHTLDVPIQSESCPPAADPDSVFTQFLEQLWLVVVAILATRQYYGTGGMGR